MLGTNAKSLDPSALGERFTGWAHGSVVNIVEEIRIKGDDKWRIMDRLKPFITNSMIQIEEKGVTIALYQTYKLPLLTNYKDALPITNDDRRFCVMYGRIQNEQNYLIILVVVMQLVTTLRRCLVNQKTRGGIKNVLVKPQNKRRF